MSMMCRDTEGQNREFYRISCGNRGCFRDLFVICQVTKLAFVTFPDLLASFLVFASFIVDLFANFAVEVVLGTDSVPRVSRDFAR